MLKPTFLIYLTLNTSLLFAQPTTTIVKKEDIPSFIRYNGNLVYAVKFTDSLGNNLVIATETGESKSKNTSADSDERDASLFAWHFIITGDSAKLLWKLTDYERECPFDITASFIKKAFTISDINKNGKSEVWLMYPLACRSDVSPTTLKLFMYENGVKSAMRGTCKTKVGKNEFAGGEFTFDEKFKKAPKAFKTFAENLWAINVLENWE